MCFEFLVMLLSIFPFFLTVKVKDHNTNGKEKKGKEFILPACLEYEGMSHCI